MTKIDRQTFLRYLRRLVFNHPCHRRLEHLHRDLTVPSLNLMGAIIPSRKHPCLIPTIRQLRHLPIWLPRPERLGPGNMGFPGAQHPETLLVELTLLVACLLNSTANLIHGPTLLGQAVSVVTPIKRAEA